MTRTRHVGEASDAIADHFRAEMGHNSQQTFLPSMRPLTTADSLHIHLNMAAEHQPTVAAPCLCSALRQASRAVSRLYDEELRAVGLRTTQYSLLRVLERAGQVRQRDLSELTFLDETTLTRNLRPLVDAHWVAVRTGDDRREKVVAITKAGTAKLAQARQAWERAQTRMQALLPEAAWQGLVTTLPEIARLAAGE